MARTQKVKALPVSRIPHLTVVHRRQEVELPVVNLGIDNIKKAFDIVIEVGEDIADLFPDPSVMGGLQFALGLGGYAAQIHVFKTALAEFRDLTVKESQAVADYIRERFDIANDQLEATIERVISLIPRTYAFVRDGIELGGDWTAVVRSIRPASAKALPLAA